MDNVMYSVLQAYPLCKIDAVLQVLKQVCETLLPTDLRNMATSHFAGQHSDWLRARWSGDRIPVRARFSAPAQTSSEAHQPPIQWVPGLSWG